MIKDIITISADDTVAKAIASMVENGVHQVPVLKNDGKYAGMVFAEHFMQANIFPRRTKILKFAANPLSLTPTLPLSQAKSDIIRSGLGALPVIYKERLVGLLTETDLVLNADLANMSVDQLMNGAIVIQGDSALSASLSTMKKYNISRLPVTDKNGRLIGSLDALDLIKVLRIPKERMSASRSTKVSSGEVRTSVRDVKVRDVMHTTTSVDLGTKLRAAVEILRKAAEIIVTNNNMPIAIITPKDIIKQLMPEHSGPSIHVSHVEDEALKSEVVTEVTKFLKRMKNRFNRIDSLEVAVDQHNNRKFSMRGKLVTSEGLTIARSVAWDIRSATRELMNRLDRRTIIKSTKRGPSKAK